VRLAALEAAILRARPALRDALASDFGRPHAETDLCEIVPALGELRYAQRHLARWMAPRRVATPLALAGARSEIRSVPRGIVAVFSPSNLPVQLALGPLVAALAAGDRVLLRVTERTPQARAVVAALLSETFAPEEVACVGGEIELAEALAAAEVDHIFFTGGGAVGRRVALAAADRGTSTTMELGGKSPAIVAPGADLGRAAERIAWGRCINAGQTCIAPDFALVDRPRAAAFAELVAACMREMYGLEPRASRDFGRLVDRAAVVRLGSAIDASLAMGARLVCGGERDAAERYVAPTVVADVTLAMPLMADEIFGPVLPIVPYDDLDVALAALRSQPTPLATYLFTGDAAQRERVLGATRSGHVAVDDVAVQWANPALPMGGLGASGHGSYHGEAGFRELSHARSVLVRSRFSLAPLLAPPFGPLTRALVAAVGVLR